MILKTLDKKLKISTINVRSIQNKHLLYLQHLKEHKIDTVKPEKNMTITFHENALKQFSRRLKFTNLASEQQKFASAPIRLPN